MDDSGLLAALSVGKALRFSHFVGSTVKALGHSLVKVYPLRTRLIALVLLMGALAFILVSE